MLERRYEDTAIVGDGQEDQRGDEDSSEDDEWDGSFRFDRDFGEEIGDSPEKTDQEEESPCLLRQ